MTDRPSREDQIREAFDRYDVGDVMVICRWNCKTPDGCPMCAHVTINHGMTAEDVIKMARPNRA
mgnify:CR=1 FL=1